MSAIPLRDATDEEIAAEVRRRASAAKGGNDDIHVMLSCHASPDTAYRACTWDGMESLVGEASSIVGAIAAIPDPRANRAKRIAMLRAEILELEATQ